MCIRDRYNPYLLANFVTDQSPCVVTPPPTTPPPANPGPSTVVVSSDVADSVSCTDGTKRVETSTYSVPRIWVDGQYVNDPNHGNWKLVGSTTEIVALSAAELSECQQLPNTGSDPGPVSYTHLVRPKWPSLRVLSRLRASTVIYR